MQEGDLVMVVGKLDSRVREEADAQNRLGTVIHVDGNEVHVLLPDLTIWKGPRRDVVMQEEQIKNE